MIKLGSDLYIPFSYSLASKTADTPQVLGITVQDGMLIVMAPLGYVPVYLASGSV